MSLPCIKQRWYNENVVTNASVLYTHIHEVSSTSIFWLLFWKRAI